MNDRIEAYFSKTLPSPERERFEQDLREDAQLAEEVAFYLHTKQVARQQALARRHAEWQQEVPSNPAPVRRLGLFRYAAAAVLVVALGGLGYWLGTSSPDTRQMAVAYVEDNLTTLPVQMSADPDSVQRATDRYNRGEYASALAASEVLLGRNPDDAQVLQLAGLAALRQQKYDEAIGHFQRLAELPDLYANPGTFYQAIAHLYRDRPQDKEKADQLLGAVISNNLEGKTEAERWLSAHE